MAFTFNDVTSKISIFFVCIFLSGCATMKVHQEKDFVKSDQNLKNFNFPEALESYPQSESGGFITSYERTWIELWGDELTDYKKLKNHNSSFQKKEYVSLVEESKYFLVQETEEGYIPAEHEVVASYLLQSMVSMKNSDFEKSRIDLKKATELIQRRSGDAQVTFDDPSLRIWMASLWYVLGEWNEARVDLRRAQELEKNPQVANLIESETPPAEMNLIFEGLMTDKSWSSLSPVPEFKKTDSHFPEDKNIVYSTWSLMNRHQERLHYLRDKSLNSKYMSQFLIDEGTTGAETLLVKSGTALTVTAGYLIGGAIFLGGIYIAANSHISGDALGSLLGLGFVVGNYISDSAIKFHDQQMQSIDTSSKVKEEARHNYRYIRYFPHHIVLKSSAAVVPGARMEVQGPSKKYKLNFIWSPNL